MLARHPDLAGLPELKSFSYPTIGEMEASRPRFGIEHGVTHRSPGLIRAVVQCVFGNQQLASLVLARSWLRERSLRSGADVLDVLMELLRPRGCVEKLPENVETDAALAGPAAAYLEQLARWSEEPSSSQMVVDLADHFAYQ